MLVAAKKINCVRAAMRTQQGALDREYRDHSAWLISLARREVGSADAEDVVHEAYIRAARYPAASRSEPRSLLARIVRNLIKDRARSWRRQKIGQRELAASGGTAAAHDAEQHSLLTLKQLIIEMPKTYRDVFMLSRFTALTQVEIADRLGISVKTVEWRLAKALAYCAKRISE